MSAKPQTSASSPAAATVLKITQIGNSVGVILPKGQGFAVPIGERTFDVATIRSKTLKESP